MTRNVLVKTTAQLFGEKLAWSLWQSPQTGPKSHLGPVKPKLPNLPASAGFKPADTPKAWDKWVQRNYQGQPRFDVSAAISNHVAQHNAQPKYEQITGDMFQRAQTNARQPFYNNATPQNKAPLMASNVSQPGTNVPILNVGNERYIGANAPLQVPESARKELAAHGTKIPENMPAHTRGLVGVHEMEHVNQDLSRSWGDYFSRHRPSHTAHAEPAAVISETVHGVDAARQATGKPVPGNFALTPQYQPSLEWMRQQAQRHGVFSGERTTQELLNTAAGQLWLQMQARDLMQNNTSAPQ